MLTKITNKNIDEKETNGDYFDPLRDNRLYPYPLQDNPYLFKIICPVQRNHFKPKTFYLLLTKHDFPIQLTAHPTKLCSIFSKCDLFISELKTTDKVRALSLEVFQSYEAIQTPQNTEYFVNMLTKCFKEEQERIVYEGLTPHERAKEIYATLEFDTSVYEAEWVIETESSIKACVYQYRKELKIALATWFDKLPSELRNAFELTAKAHWGENFNCNDLHPIFGYEMLNKVLGALTHTGIDNQIISGYLPQLGKSSDCVDGLEYEEDRLNASYLGIYQQGLLQENNYSFQGKLDFLFNFDCLTYMPPPFKWDPLTISYFNGETPLTAPVNKAIEERDEKWKPIYLQQIKTLQKTNTQRRNFYFVGLSHGYNFLKTLREYPELVSKIKRYNREKGWVNQ